MSTQDRSIETRTCQKVHVGLQTASQLHSLSAYFADDAHVFPDSWFSLTVLLPVQLCKQLCFYAQTSSSYGGGRYCEGHQDFQFL